MRHRETTAHDLARRDVDHDAAACTMLAPAIGDVGLGNTGDIGWPTVAHGQTVQVAAILRRQPRDEGGFHSGLKLCVSLVVARQENRVLTKTSLPSVS